MTTYRDHPHAFLASRVSPQGLRGRADSWREQGLAVDGFDIPATLDRAASLIEAMNDGFAELADLTGQEAGPDAVQAALQRLPVMEASEADELWATGQALRDGWRDPHGGSTASHLETAADELRHLAREAERLREADPGDAERIRHLALGATGRLVATPTHEGPALRM